MTDLLGSFRDVLLARSLHAAQRGDREAFRALYRSLHPVVWRFVRRRCRSDAEAEEIVGQTFFRLLERLAKVDAKQGVRGYVLTIAANALTDAARDRARRDDGAVPELVDPAGSPLDRLISVEDQAQLTARMAALPAVTWQLLTLRYADGLRFSEIAQLTGITETAARQRISRAVRELRTHLVSGSGEQEQEVAR
jgi:RNA polymerase sigma-70 factor (ECF subfamily)